MSTILLKYDHYMFKDIVFRWIEANSRDAMIVTRWRNTADARESFFNDAVVTPDTHLSFMQNKKEHDLIWIMEKGPVTPIGMLSLTVNVKDNSAEYGRLFIDGNHRGEGIGKIADQFVITYCFDELKLDRLWLDALTTNTAVIDLHTKNGFGIDGVNLAGHENKRGDVIVMSITKDVWEHGVIDQFFTTRTIKTS